MNQLSYNHFMSYTCLCKFVQCNEYLFSEFDLIGMLTRQLYLAENQIQSMQSVLKKAEDRLKTKDQEIGRLKRKVF